MDKLTYTVKEAAEIVGIGPSTLYDLVRKDKVPNIKLGGRYLIPKEQFQIWVNKIVRGDTLCKEQ